MSKTIFFYSSSDEVSKLVNSYLEDIGFPVKSENPDVVIAFSQEDGKFDLKFNVSELIDTYLRRFVFKHLFGLSGVKVDARKVKAPPFSEEQIYELLSAGYKNEDSNESELEGSSCISPNNEIVLNNKIEELPRLTHHAHRDVDSDPLVETWKPFNIIKKLGEISRGFFKGE